jgi:hypothetical protein
MLTIYFTNSNDPEPLGEQRVIISLLHITKLEPLVAGQ